MPTHRRTPEIRYPFPDGPVYALFLLSFNTLIKEHPHTTGELDHTLQKALARWDANNPWEDWVIVNRRGDEIFRTSTLLLSPVIRPMLDLMMKRHENQIRKGDGADYREHPLEVAHILRQHGFDGETVAGGLGHDLLEETDATEEEIVQAGGEGVLRSIKTLSQPDLTNWREKKLHHIAQIRSAGPREAAIFAADHIANLRALLEIYGKRGEAIWSGFNAGKEEKLWYERLALVVAREQLLGHPMVGELEELVNRFQAMKPSSR